ncbi:UV radiation resistance protein/autophagy-related protein 14 [Lasallia pustulata]|uniref:Autophagy-related protein 14 n=1 Tax=Lasallia pustulata TaxID=136370 RepID=A0A1W5D0L1_9LECA|nr:UV radiation resistance protein/autophagy-related protein 14 [Lasallia pustulata]
MPSEHTSGSDNQDVFTSVKGLPRDKPWLMPSNRKLRHLQGISLRNLTFSHPSDRARGKTIDDESLPYAFKSPTKLLSQQETHKLEHSRSSNDLRSSTSDNGSPTKRRFYRADGATETSRPIGKLRRSSTLNWSNSTPSVRQKRLEDVTVGRLADTWFSIHCSDIEEPVYVSEVVEKALNPSFRFFDLNAHGPLVTRRDELTMKFWAKTEKMGDYILLVELQLHLRSLQFVGRALENFHHPLPPNCLLFHLSDGIYTSFTDLPLDEPPPYPILKQSKLQVPVESTSSFDALMRLSNLDDCIQDALATREKLASQINALLEKHQEASNTINSVSKSQESLASTQHAISSSKKQSKSAQKRRADLLSSIEARRAAMAAGTSTQEKAASHLSSAETKLASSNSLVRTTAAELQGQIRRICEDLMRIYPIEPIEGKTLSFTIRSLPLSNSNFSSTSSPNEETTAAALGMVAHLVHLLSFYLSTPLPYPMAPFSSSSHIKDPITITVPETQRTFPLYQKGQAPYRFEFGVFLLNTNIELLMSRQGLRMVDQRHTLPNLKYLLYVLTSGKGELPARKMGGIRGLGGGSRASSFRDSSPDSMEPDKGIDAGRGKAGAARKDMERPTLDLGRLSLDGTVKYDGGNGSVRLGKSPLGKSSSLRTKAFRREER